MTDAEISRRLALAIGWKEEQMEASLRDGCVLLPGGVFEMWRNFDYRDPAVIWPIAERFDAFPAKIGDGWDVYYPDTDEYTRSETAAKAVALAVIKAKEQQ